MLDKMLDTRRFRGVLKKEKALNPLRLKASEMAPPCWTRTNDPAVNSGCDANIKQCHSIPCSVEP